VSLPRKPGKKKKEGKGGGKGWTSIVKTKRGPRGNFYGMHNSGCGQGGGSRGIKKQCKGRPGGDKTVPLGKEPLFKQKEYTGRTPTKKVQGWETK